MTSRPSKVNPRRLPRRAEDGRPPCHMCLSERVRYIDGEYVCAECGVKRSKQ